MTMERFARLYRELDASTRATEKHEALVRYFREAVPGDAAWAVALFTGRRPKRAVSPGLMRRAASEFAGIPEWLIDVCRESVGDGSETLALLLPEPERATDPPGLREAIEEIVIPLRAMDDLEKLERLKALWSTLRRDLRYILHKLIAGGMRVGVQQRTVARALADVAPDDGVDSAVIEHRLSGAWSPTPEAFHALLAPADDRETGARPYPFFLASPIDDADVVSLGEPGDWIAERKWDGVRAQLIRRAGLTTLWSRGDEPLTDAFPELVQLGALLPDGTVLDGEVLAFDDRPLPFTALQKRILRKQRDIMLFDDVPVVFMVYDLLESEGKDVRARPLRERRAMLDHVIDALIAHHGVQRHLARSPAVRFGDWDTLAHERGRSRELGVEGLMLKRLDSPYRTGRVRGDWWKWKVDPYTIDAVLVYAQLGSGKRATRFTDYTFALWDRDPGEPGAELTPFAKAYSGLSNEEIEEVDREIRASIIGKKGPIRAVEPSMVFELAFEGVQRSNRHKAGLALRFPRMARRRTDKAIGDADTLGTLQAMLPEEHA
ncbi:MAG: ATP-dependent DNA ligase [Phycisphaerales bacterium]